MTHAVCCCCCCCCHSAWMTVPRVTSFHSLVQTAPRVVLCLERKEDGAAALRRRCLLWVAGPAGGCSGELAVGGTLPAVSQPHIHTLTAGVVVDVFPAFSLVQLSIANAGTFISDPRKSRLAYKCLHSHYYLRQLFCCQRNVAE